MIKISNILMHRLNCTIGWAHTTKADLLASIPDRRSVISKFWKTVLAACPLRK